MAELRIRTARHTIRVAAPPRRVYQLIADVDRWPLIFDPTVTVEHLGLDAASERVRMWELVDNEVHNCVSRRALNPHRLQIRFRQEHTSHPIATMGGLWLVVPKGSGSLVVLDHYYRVVDDNPVDVRWLANAVDRNSTTMLAALREAAELGGELDQLWLSCEDGVDIDGNARDVYDFLARAQDSVHVCFPETHIVFKQTRLPAIMRAHTGSWAVTRLPHGVRATAHHTVLLRRGTVTELIGPGSTVDDARAMVRQVLSTLSLATLGRAKAFAESRRPAGIGAPPT